MPVHRDTLQIFQSQTYKRTQSDWEWTTLPKSRNHCKAEHKCRGLPGSEAKVGAEGCEDFFGESREETIIRKNGYPSFLWVF